MICWRDGGRESCYAYYIYLRHHTSAYVSIYGSWWRGKGNFFLQKKHTDTHTTPVNFSERSVCVCVREPLVLLFTHRVGKGNFFDQKWKVKKEKERIEIHIKSWFYFSFRSNPLFFHFLSVKFSCQTSFNSSTVRHAEKEEREEKWYILHLLWSVLEWVQTLNVAKWSLQTTQLKYVSESQVEFFLWFNLSICQHFEISAPHESD